LTNTANRTYRRTSPGLGLTIPLYDFDDVYVSEGDLVIVAVSIADIGDTNQGSVNLSMQGITGTSNTFTKLYDLFADDGTNTNFGVFYSVIGSVSEDERYSISWGTINVEEVSAVVTVWSGAKRSSPIDAQNSATFINGGVPNAPAVTTLRQDSVVLALGGASRVGYNSLTAPSGMDLLGELTTIDGVGSCAIASTFVETPGSYNPAAFGGGTGDFQASAAAVTLAIRPE
jgi:hypothetical protein